MQLQAFLFDENVPQYGRSVQNKVGAIARMQTFQGIIEIEK